MKLTDTIVNRFGTDKVMHFLGGAWITALATPFGWWGILVAFILTMVLSFVKEKRFDTTFDWYDILAAFSGSVATMLIYIIISVLL